MAVYESAVAFLPVVYESTVWTSIRKCSMTSIRKGSMCVYEMNGTPFKMHFSQFQTKIKIIHKDS